jgi:mannitol/fructose-specific phosphotransferase system IIA component (Ntr-type)
MIKLADFVVPEAIICDLRARTNEEAVREMVDALCAAGCVGAADREEVIQAILLYALLGMGCDGFATLKARHPAVARTVGTIALSRSGVEFPGALDERPVHLLFLVVSPPIGPEHSPGAEDVIMWLLFNHDYRDFRDRLRRAGTREEVVGLLAEADRESPWEADLEASRERDPAMVGAGKVFRKARDRIRAREALREQARARRPGPASGLASFLARLLRGGRPAG